MMHYALLRNYLGIEEMLGSEFQRIARQQVTAFGGAIHDARVDRLERDGDGFAATLESGESVSARYLILSEGKAPKLAKQLGLAFDPEGGIPTDKNGHTDVAGVYVVGRSARPRRSQAIISAGDGAAAAIDILSREKGASFTDWDEPPK
jgi:thioredoxin reductase